MSKTSEVYTFSREKAKEIQRALGTRTDKRYDNEYLRKSGFAGNYQFWDELTQRWVPVRRGMQFQVTPEGPRMVMT